MIFFSCKEEEDVYYINYKNQPFEITAARVLHDGKNDQSNLRTLKLYLYTEKISFDVEEEKGTGASLKLELFLDSSDIKDGVYDVLEEERIFSIKQGEKNDVGKITGSYFKQMYSSEVSKLIKTNYYNNLDNENKVKAINKIRDKAVESLKKEYGLGKKGVKRK